ncbi:uncharacterized protein PAC_15162 [Phialocephala subalpina]|uniref:Myb-like domain-containing protein n=1 Tax=Phialocephala subalpina TaxID=576137 RepID=A0A1L7XJP4_9HELO|nr:uncharacterized protein PAC_15162 [Phialocephala subalpina]
MATVDMNFIQIYQPRPSNPSSRRKKRSVSTSNSDGWLSRASSSELTPGIVATPTEGVMVDHSSRREEMRQVELKVRNYDPTNGGDGSGDGSFLIIDELLRTTQPTDATTAKPSKPERALQHPGKPALEVNGSLTGQTQTRLSNLQDGGQDQPVVIEDEEPDTAEAEAGAEVTDFDTGCADQDARVCDILPTQDATSELSKPIGPSGPWYDVEAGCYVDEAEETSSGIYQSEGNERRHDTGDEDDEEPRPEKRRKLPSVSTDVALTPLEHSPTPHLRRPHSLMPSSTTQSEMGDARSQADHGHLPALSDDGQHHHHPPRASRSPSATVESAPVAEYQEWPSQGFLKRTRIGTPPPPMRSNKETSAEAVTPHDAGAHSKMHPAAVRPRIKRVRWTPGEGATVLKMREADGCSWEEIHAALPHRTPGTIQMHYSTKLKK